MTRNVLKKFIWSILVYLVRVRTIKAEPAWFQVCDAKQKYSLNSVDCHLGLWLPKPLKAGCVCLNGVWIVSSGLCDAEAMLLVGSGDCFNIEKEIRSVKLLSNLEDPFEPATYVVSGKFDSFARVPEKGYNPSLRASSSFVVTINPNSSLRRADHDICLSVDSRLLGKPVHLWKNSRRVSDQFKFVPDSKCEVPTRYDTHVDFGEIYRDEEVLDTEGQTADCAHHCLITPDSYKDERKPRPVKVGRVAISGKHITTGGRAVNARGSKGPVELLDKAGLTKIRWDGLYSLHKKLKFIGGENLTEEGRQYRKNMYLLRQNITLWPMAHSRETREQSVRMLQAHTNFLLLNKPAPKINTPEYDYFQKARQIFMSIAPNDIMPHKVMNGLTRMWRLLLWESHDKFQYRENPNPIQYGRIMENLEICLVNVSAQPMYFVTDVMITVGEENKTKPSSIHGCWDKYPPAETLVYWNDTEQTPGSATINYVKSSLLLPRHLKFVKESFDLSIDLAWKMFMFTFYHCSIFFEKNANDHSEMAEKIQSLFNYRVLKRWYTPEGFNEVLPLVFPGFNVTRFGEAMDRLVAAAKDASQWMNWLSRPPLSITDPDIPKKSKWLRQKRSARNSKTKIIPFWGSRANCMYDFTDPIHIFGAKPSRGCHVNDVY